jgi:hypothetical protein
MRHGVETIITRLREKEAGEFRLLRSYELERKNDTHHVWTSTEWDAFIMAQRARYLTVKSCIAVAIEYGRKETA